MTFWRAGWTTSTSAEHRPVEQEWQCHPAQWITICIATGLDGSKVVVLDGYPMPVHQTSDDSDGRAPLQAGQQHCLPCGGLGASCPEVGCIVECAPCGGTGISRSTQGCPHCDGTGDVHRADGEWLGVCDCPAGTSAEPRDAQGGDTLTVDANRLKHTVATLIGAVAAYEKYARRYATRGPADPLFGTRLADMNRAAEDARRMLQEGMNDV